MVCVSLNLAHCSPAATPFARSDARGHSRLVTGAASGIGAATARALRARGANVVLLDLHLEAVEAVARSIGDGQMLPIAADVTDREALDAAVRQSVAHFGALGVVFANAGIVASPPTTVASIDPDVFERVVEVNLLGVWRTVRAALPQIIANQGHVLVTSSVYAFVNGVVNAPYAAAKAGVEQLARALRVELARHGATAGVLHPGWVATPLARNAFGGHETVTRMREMAFPAILGKAVTPEAVAARVVDGIARRSPRITAPRRWEAVAAVRGLIGPLTDRGLVRDTRLHELIRRLEH
ncbi:short-chain dehydrogenase/reductase [Streptomyces sp. NPDC058293]|uniref:short-chain dehydrogenase/reductase n=1 Tax=Streptomyces sp. NPDC058293 TaxID=3346429 RepID=UPI0036E5C6A2